MTDFSFDALRREPDVEAPNLVAADAADRLILETAAGAIAASPERVVVIGDGYGALALGAAALHGARGIRVHQDALSGERALALNAERFGLGDVVRSLPLDVGLVRGARVVLLRLPRSLAALDEIATLIAAHADPDVVVLAGARVKHMALAMNEVLGRSFRDVAAGLARQKARVVTAKGPTAAEDAAWPRRAAHEVPLGPGATGRIVVCAHGGAFAGTSIDIGTRFLLEHLGALAEGGGNVVDLGCGTGVLATAVATVRPGLEVVAVDQSAAAVASASATAEANGIRVRVVRDDGLSSFADGSVDRIVLNPPFHIGAAVHAGIALKLFDEAARALRPGGELLAVWNSHLRYRGVLERTVGPTRQLGRNAKFTVTLSTRR